MEDGTVSNNQAREVLELLWEHPDMDAAAAAAQLGYKKADSNELEATVQKVLEENAADVEALKAGNSKIINALTGKVMKASNPKPNPRMVTEIITRLLGL